MSRAWSWRHAVLNSNLPPTTRHVLLTISCHMNDVGGGCYPTTATLAAETGLSERSICTHIMVASEAKWLKVSEHGFKGQRWSRHVYEATWPDDEKGTEPDAEGTEGGSVPCAEGTEPDAEGTEPDDKKALKEVQCNIPEINSQSLSHTAREELTAGERVCEILDLKLDAWHMRVAEHFIAPLERCLNVRGKHRQAMPDLVDDLASYSSATLAMAAGAIRRERSVFPTIAQAIETCKAAAKATTKPCSLRTDQEREAWRRHLTMSGNKIALRLFESGSSSMFDGELLKDVLEIYGSEASP